MTALRYLALLVLPSCFAFIVSLAGEPDSMVTEHSDALLSALLSGNEQAVDATLTELIGDIEETLDEALADPERNFFKRLAWLKNLAIASIAIGFCLLALVISPRLSAQSKANALTTLAIGYCIANFTIGFRYMGWTEFLQLAFWGFAGACVVLLLRSYLQNNDWRRT